MKKIIGLIIAALFLASCAPLSKAVPTTSPAASNPNQTPSPSFLPTITSQPTGQVTNTAIPSAPLPAVPSPVPSTPTPQSSLIPRFDHVVLIMLENRGYSAVVDTGYMPNLKALAKKYVLLTKYFAVAHPSLPNYIALMSGSTQGIASDCTSCFVNGNNLASEIEQSGRTWKAYMESMPSPCFIGNQLPYAQKHNPLLYFDGIRTNTSLCENSIVPLTQLDADLSSNNLPNFAYIMPNLCDSGHDCSSPLMDQWVSDMVTKLQASPSMAKNSLIIITFDEANFSDKSNCCGLGSGGGHVATILISPDARPGFKDNTPYSHYSLLKTILQAWNLPDIGATQSSDIPSILAPWTNQ